MLSLRVTEDGSYTFYSAIFQENFHSASGAQQEAEAKFVEPCRLSSQAAGASHLCLLDVCYGLGYNTAAALKRIWAVNPHCYVTVMALEKDPQVPQEAIAAGLLAAYPPAVSRLLTTLAWQGDVTTSRLQARMLWGSARQTLPSLVQSGFQAHAIFLDPFSPPKCPQLWTVEFLSLVARCLQPQGYVATYSCAAAVRTALQLAGLAIGSGPQVGRRSPGTLARLDAQHLVPLSQKEQEHLQTKAAIPYRDPSLQDPAQVIRARRVQEQSECPWESSRAWKERWLGR